MIPTADIAAIEPFLRDHITTSMFPLTNVLNHGIDGGHPRAMAFWRHPETGPITDLLGVSEEGIVMPCFTTAQGEAAAKVLAGRSLIGIIGATQACRAMRDALGLQGAAANIDSDEVLFTLALDDLRMPDTDLRIIPFADAPRDVIVPWLQAYLGETLGTPIADAQQESHDRFDNFSAAGSHVVLMDGDEPVAMTGFNARLPDIVQIGGVYTPPDMRGRGHARTAVALHLQQARDQGATNAILFSENPAAMTAYRAIGFAKTGHFTLCIFANPVEVPRG